MMYLVKALKRKRKGTAKEHEDAHKMKLIFRLDAATDSL